MDMESLRLRAPKEYNALKKLLDLARENRRRSYKKSDKGRIDARTCRYTLSSVNQQRNTEEKRNLLSSNYL
jgi:hypothetical protein